MASFTIICKPAITTTSAPFPKFVIHGGTLGHELRKQRGTSKYMIAHDPAKWTPVRRKDHAPPIVSARPDAKPEATFAGRARAAYRFEVPETSLRQVMQELQIGGTSVILDI